MQLVKLVRTVKEIVNINGENLRVQQMDIRT